MARARTYDVNPEWVLPDLAASLPSGASLEADVTTRRTSFFDTGDRTLHRRGITVAVADETCTVQLPGEEFTALATGRTVPRDVQRLLLGARSGKRLLPIARTEVLRQVTRVVGADRDVRAEIADDAVTATASDISEVTENRREITLTASDNTLRSAIDKALKKSGAKPVTRPQAEPVLALTSLAADAHAAKPAKDTLGLLVTDYLDEQYDALLQTDVALRRGHEVVHAARVATRRYRSVLRVFADLLDADRAASLDRELQWYAQLLGDVRDAQVQRAHLDEAVHALAPELVLGPVAARIDEHLLGEQLRARTRLDQSMRGQRYLALLAEVEAWHANPPVTDKAARGPQASATYLRRAERKLDARLRAVKHGDDDTLHRARKAAKRARYTAELATPVLGGTAERTVARGKGLQDVLGEHQDSVVACSVLLHLGAATVGVPNENGFTFGLLHHAERDRADRLRAEAVKTAHG